MKKAFLFTMVALFTLSFSCEKWGKKDGVSTYYSEDYRDSNNSYLGEQSSNIDELYFHFYDDKERANNYKFVAEVNGDYVWHEGTFVKTQYSLTFTPDDQNHAAFEGSFSEDGKVLTIDYPGVDDTRVQVNFILKEKDHYCGFGK